MKTCKNWKLSHKNWKVSYKIFSTIIKIFLEKISRFLLKLQNQTFLSFFINFPRHHFTSPLYIPTYRHQQKSFLFPRTAEAKTTISARAPASFRIFWVRPRRRLRHATTALPAKRCVTFPFSPPIHVKWIRWCRLFWGVCLIFDRNFICVTRKNIFYVTERRRNEIFPNETIYNVIFSLSRFSLLTKNIPKTNDDSYELWKNDKLQ